VRKPVEELHEVLTPKVAGVVNLDEATRGLPLDLFVTFSSASSVLGAVGQADYATANAFLDQYAHHRATLVAKGERSGRSVTINWPWWEAGGMQLAVTSAASMSRRGLRPLATTQGLEALYRAVASGHPQIVVLAGRPQDARALMMNTTRRQRTENAMSLP